MREDFNPEDLTVSWIQQVHAYVPGEQPQSKGWVKLNTNENPYPPSAQVAKAVAEQIEALRLYPQPQSEALRVAIAERFALTADQVIIGNGSDNILDMITRSFVGLGQAGHSVPILLYPVVVGLSGGDLINIPFEASMELPSMPLLKRQMVFFSPIPTPRLESVLAR